MAKLLSNVEETVAFDSCVFMCVHVYVWVCTCVCAYVCMGAYVYGVHMWVSVHMSTWVCALECGGHRSNSGAIHFVFCFVLLSWDRICHCWGSLIRLGWLASKPQEPACLCLPRARIASTCQHVLYREFKSRQAPSSSGKEWVLFWLVKLNDS